jgi:very-short-patch-repair endonuclease
VESVPARECDGASYHSGRSARDRDRLRQEILENLGWKIHRIWSTDWFRSRETEIKRLLRRVEELRR